LSWLSHHFDITRLLIRFRYFRRNSWLSADISSHITFIYRHSPLMLRRALRGDFPQRHRDAISSDFRRQPFCHAFAAAITPSADA
jgi:hypothetical protein